jgi:hypothetical protein
MDFELVILDERVAGVRWVGDRAAVADDVGYVGERPTMLTWVPARGAAASGRASVVSLGP